MSNDVALAAILADQTAEGAFRSIILVRDRRVPDANGFITAQVLRALRGLPSSPTLATARARALDFLERCEAPDRPGAFGFWPRGTQPPWIPVLPEDADDTAVIPLELVRHGRREPRALEKVAFDVLLPYRVPAVHQPAPPWLRPGVFPTWLRRGRPNVVDCCVNANVVALLAYAGLQQLPGFDEACAMITAGIVWAGDSYERARALVPFYPHPGELILAVEHAVACGAELLAPSLHRLCQTGWGADGGVPPLDQPLCGSAYGRTIWIAPVVQRARALGRAITAGGVP